MKNSQGVNNSYNNDTITKGLKMGLGDLETKTTSGDHPNDSIIKIGQKNTRRLEETCRHSNSSGRPSANADVKNFNE